MRITLLFAAWLLSGQLAAQSLFEVPMGAQAQIYIGSTGQVESCGLRVTGVHVGTSEMRVFDTSLVLRVEGHGFGKITGQQGLVSEGVGGLRPVEVYGGWFRAEGKRPTMPLSSYFDGETPNSKLFISEWEPAIQVLDAIATGRPIQLAISWERGTRAIYFGVAQIDEPQKDQFQKCLTDLASVMLAQIEP